MSPRFLPLSQRALERELGRVRAAAASSTDPPSTSGEAARGPSWPRSAATGALLSSLRQLQQQQQQQQVVAEVVAEPPTPPPPPQAEPPATPTPTVDAAVARAEAAAAFVSPIARLPAFSEVARRPARTGGGDAARPRAAVSAGLLDELQALSSELSRRSAGQRGEVKAMRMLCL